MITRQTIETITAQLHIPTFGIAPWPLPANATDYIHTENPCPFINGTLEERLTGNTEISAQSAIVCLFPYFMGRQTANLPKYAWADDYHLVVKDYLTRLGQALQEVDESVQFEVHCDTSPLADRYMAYLAGLGVFGRNRALINPQWGSYTSIGTLLTTIPLEPNKPMDETCLSCNSCVKACPGQSLGHKDFRFQTCKSYLTQKKGELTDEEEKIIQKSALIWGCDICQDVCPHNRQVPLTPIKEFQHIEPVLKKEDLQDLSNRQFKEAFGHRAFAWRGKATLLRNFDIVEHKE
ncbi:epoxyqueuosine reductase [uncultured Veillonella sp.]|uniref:epoxyqueuosine reductase n=1 Tax=uncultured Veillonella sp. TaxID=159268 RepID=UPI0025EFBD78|nr:QueG-associated DUF1730 domain-containing protein [uncultured Veillonella sp.]